MRRIHIILTLLIFYFPHLSCNKILFVDKKYKIEKSKGLAVFLDIESRKFRNVGNGDVFIDSLMPDFFIKYDFSKKIISKKDIDKALLSRSEVNVFFFKLIRDCGDADRTSSIEQDCITLLLDKNVDSFLHSSKVYVQPVEFEFIRSNIDRDYFELHKSLTISYTGKQIKLILNKGLYEILKTNVLEYDWK